MLNANASTRERLPQRRPSMNIEFSVERPRVAPIAYVATIGFYPDGRLAEIFLRSGKAGTDLAIQSQAAGILASLLLQHGATPEFIRKSMPRTADGVAEEAIGTLLDLLKKEGIIP